jgi:hypothetical protein
MRYEEEMKHYTRPAHLDIPSSDEGEEEEEEEGRRKGKGKGEETPCV